MAKRVVIFCEGEDNGMDSKVLNKLFEQVGITYHDVRPMGGKKCAKAIVDSFKRSDYKASQASKAFFLRDRDFDYGYSINQKLDPGKLSLSDSREIAFGRSMIENYLLDAELFLKFGKTIAPPNARNKFNLIGEVEQLFIEVAEGLAFHQAMRFAFATFSQKVRDERYESKKIDKLVTTTNYNLPFS